MPNVIACCLALGLVFVAKASTLGTPYYWDELNWVPGALWLADGNLLRVIPGWYPPATFLGRPPGLPLSLGILFTLVGPSITAAHLLIAAFSALGLFATYQLGRLLYGPDAGVLAALFLFAMPVYFAQSGMFIADVPVAAVGAATVYLALRRRRLAYLLSAAYLVFLKETAMAIIVALTLYTAATSGRAWRHAIREALICAAPLLLIGAFIVAQRLITGRATVFDDDISLFELGIGFDKLERITRWLLLDQSRYLLTAALVLNLIVNGISRSRRELLLFAAIALLVACPFIVVYFLPRYLTPVLPYLCIAGAGAVTELLRWRVARVLCGVFFIAAMHVSPHVMPDSSHEWNMRYVDVVRAHRAAYASLTRLLDADGPDTRHGCVLTVWPHSVQLARPEMGYVERPIRVVDYADTAHQGDVADCDLILLSEPAGSGKEGLRDYADANGFAPADRVADGLIVAEVHRRTDG